MNVSHKLMQSVVGDTDLSQFFGHTWMSPLEHAFTQLVDQAGAEATAIKVTSQSTTIVISQKIDDMQFEVASVTLPTETQQDMDVFTAFMSALLLTTKLVPASHFKHHLNGQYWSDKFEMWVSIPSN